MHNLEVSNIFIPDVSCNLLLYLRLALYPLFSSSYFFPRPDPVPRSLYGVDAPVRSHRRLLQFFFILFYLSACLANKRVHKWPLLRTSDVGSPANGRRTLFRLPWLIPPAYLRMEHAVSRWFNHRRLTNQWTVQPEKRRKGIVNLTKVKFYGTPLTEALTDWCIATLHR